LYVALPDAIHVARQFVGLVLSWQRACGFEHLNSLKDEAHVKPTLHAKFQILVELFAILYLVHSLESSGTYLPYSLHGTLAPCRYGCPR